MASQDLDSAKNQAEFDRLMTAANVFRRRGDYPQATQTIKQALQLRPADMDAREFAADMLYAHGEVEKAAEYYKNILAEDSTRTSAEEKYAKAVLDIAEGKRQKDLLKMMIENPTQFHTTEKSATLAVIISAAPGFGQIYCGQYLRGMVLLGAWLLALVLFILTLGSSSVNGQLLNRITPSSLIFMCIAGMIHIYTLVDAAVQAEKVNKKAKKSSEPE